MKNSIAPKNQDGLALITVLLVFFIASLLAVGMIDRQQGDIHRLDNYLSQAQLHLYMLSAEELAIERLWNDFEVDTENIRNNADQGFKDTLDEEWNELATLELGLGTVELQLVDLQSFFNLNSLVPENDLSGSYISAFEEMMAVLGVLNAEEIKDEVLSKFEDGSRFASIGELRELSSVSTEDYNRLRACLMVAPPYVTLNLNTAPETILLAWSSIIVPNQREDLLLQREREEGLNRLPSLPGDLSAFSINSEYFQANIKAEFQGKTIFTTSTLFRDVNSGEISVIARRIGRFNGNDGINDLDCTRL